MNLPLQPSEPAPFALAALALAAHAVRIDLPERG
ncbi:hypothetical protein H4CHR_05401 [Variovorax sp. PBS-H4]|nr:hypothetical protein H4CHR_05401 [Variovorax sp. PBS-H4]